MTKFHIDIQRTLFSALGALVFGFTCIAAAVGPAEVAAAHAASIETVETVDA